MIHGLLLLTICMPPSLPQSGTPSVEMPAPFAPTAEELMGHVAFLAHDRMRGRGAGTPEEALAAAYIAAEFYKLGLESIEQPFEVPDTTVEGGALESRNVIAWLPGGEQVPGGEHILIGAHFDHLGVRNDAVYNGADDNASGVAGLLGIAHALAGGPTPRRSILFVAFGSEEIGLRGSRHYVTHPVRPLEGLVAMINFDMIGHGNFLDGEAMKQIRIVAGLEPGPGIGLIGGSYAPELLELARDAFDYEEIPLYAPEDYPRAVRDMVAGMTAGRSDHAPFQDARIPYLFFSTSEHDRYHKTTDDLDTVDGEVLRAVARAAYRTVLAIDALEERPEFVGGN